jgi:hypothetical protein
MTTTRRILLAGIGAAAAASTIQPAAAALPGRFPIPHDQLGVLWGAIRSSANWAEFQSKLPAWGGFPWVFVGRVNLTGEGFHNVQVNVLEVVPDARGAAIGVPGILVDYEVVEPAHMGGRKTFRTAFRGFA